MADNTRSCYSVEARLADILRIYPVERHSLWFAAEPIWERANPSYANVRNRKRKGHFGLVAASLVAAKPVTVPLCHGHSDAKHSERWFHLRVSGLTREEPNRMSWFDVWHRYPVAWHEFLTDAIQRNLDKQSLDEGERKHLERIEDEIEAKTQSDYTRALNQYQGHPAWQQHFPELASSENSAPSIGRAMP